MQQQPEWFEKSGNVTAMQSESCRVCGARNAPKFDSIMDERPKLYVRCEMTHYEVYKVHYLDKLSIVSHATNGRGKHEHVQFIAQ